LEHEEMTMKKEKKVKKVLAIKTDVKAGADVAADLCAGDCVCS
jgi:hypothetical protein